MNYALISAPKDILRWKADIIEKVIGLLALLLMIKAAMNVRAALFAQESVLILLLRYGSRGRR